MGRRLVLVRNRPASAVTDGGGRLARSRERGRRSTFSGRPLREGVPACVSNDSFSLNGPSGPPTRRRRHLAGELGFCRDGHESEGRVVGRSRASVRDRRCLLRRSRDAPLHRRRVCREPDVRGARRVPVGRGGPHRAHPARGLRSPKTTSAAIGGEARRARPRIAGAVHDDGLTGRWLELAERPMASVRVRGRPDDLADGTVTATMTARLGST